MSDARGRALARLYDLDLAEDPGDLDLYLALAARAAGPVLELAAGTGRLAVPLAAAGHRVTAVDIDPDMLERARERATAAGAATAARIEFVEADLIGLRLASEGSFELAFVALNSIFLLPSRDAQRECFRTLQRHLAPGGLAVVDVWLPDGDDIARFDGRLVVEYVRDDPETGTTVTKAASARYDSAARVVSLSSIYEEGSDGTAPIRWLRHDELRLISADELRDFAGSAGLEVETLAGGYDLDPIGPASDRAVIVAVRR